MHILRLERVPPSRRKTVEIWYPAATVFLSPQAMNRTGLAFETADDDLDKVRFAYAELEGVPMMLMRYFSEPEGHFSLVFDAPGYVRTTGRGAGSFRRVVLPMLHLTEGQVLWRNEQLEKLFPDAAPRHPSR